MILGDEFTCVIHNVWLDKIVKKKSIAVGTIGIFLCYNVLDVIWRDTYG